MTKKPLCISIDFEDIYNDYLLRLDLDKNYIIREEALHKSYLVIKKIISKYFSNTKITFFTTGILGEKIPDLIKEICNDGNEIACHHYYQEDVYKMTINQFESDLEKSKRYLCKATDTDVFGYRAPNFSINYNVETYLKLIFKYFDYDSSVFSDLYHNEKIKKLCLGEYNKKEFYIHTKKINFYFKNFRIKPGGTYFRVLNKGQILNLLDDAHKRNFLPLIYLHPYDFLYSKEFWIEIDKFKKLNLFKKYFQYFRQIQWHTLGNKTIEDKLSYLSEYYEHMGNMKDNFSTI